MRNMMYPSNTPRFISLEGFEPSFPDGGSGVLPLDERDIFPAGGIEPPT